MMTTTNSQRRPLEITLASSSYFFNSTGDEEVPSGGTWTTTSGVPISPSGPLPMGVDLLLMKYLLPFIIFGGTVGNTLSIAVLSRPCMRYSSVYFYLLVLACADTLVLYVSAFKTWIRLVSGYELLHVSNAACKVLMFVLLVSMTLSAWFVVCMTADRFVAVWFPFRASFFCNVSRARLATVGLLGASVALHCHVFWTVSLFRANVGARSILICGLESMSRPFEYVKIATYCVIPFVVIVCLNVAIIVRLRSSAKATIQMAGNRCGGRPSSTRMRTASILRHVRDPYSQTRVTSMLLTVSFAWLLLTSPFTIYGIFVSLTNRWNLVLKAVCFILMYTNHAVNFGLYCLTGRKFRRELVELFVRFARRRRRQRVPSASPSVKTQRPSNVVELDQSPSEAERHLREIRRTRSDCPRSRIQ